MRNLVLGVFFMSMWACSPTEQQDKNPEAPGFNMEASDAKAIEIADMVMEASGGRAAWDSTDYFQWRFFGNRLHKWNKATGDLIIESEKDSSYYHMNMETMKGMAVIKGDTLGPLESQEAYLQRAKEYWINDSYWIFLPFKLKDSGVTLKYVGEGEAQDGTASELLQLTFEEVGVTPENKYVVYVDKATKLICQWDFYGKYSDEEPKFSTPWADYKNYGGLMLASDRGNGRGMQDIKVGEDLAAAFAD